MPHNGEVRVSSNFGEIFELELKCWCHGLSRVRERVDRHVIHQVIKEFAGVLTEAVENLFVCDVADTARRLVTAGKCPGLEKEIAFHILSYLPLPSQLNREQTAVLRKTVEKLDRVHPGAMARLERKWRADGRNAPAPQASSALGSLSFPPKLAPTG